MIPTYTDGHCHLLTYGDFANGIVPILAKVLYHSTPRNKFIKAMRLLARGLDNDDIERIANLLDLFGETTEGQFKKLKQLDPPGTTYCVITIDQQYMGRGNVPTPYHHQIAKVCRLIDKGEPIKLFVHIDPRREDYLKLLTIYREYISGVKQYNYMGYFPYDPLLDSLYHQCELHNWPVVFHCSPHNINWYGGKDINNRLRSSIFPLYKTRNTPKYKSMNFSNPSGMINVALRHPNVNFIVEHLGGKSEAEAYWRGEEGTWTGLLAYAAETLDNLYLGTSYTTYSKAMYLLIGQLYNRIPNKLIWGRDFPVSKMVSGLHQTTIELRKEIGEAQFLHIANNINKLIR